MTMWRTVPSRTVAIALTSLLVLCVALPARAQDAGPGADAGTASATDDGGHDGGAPDAATGLVPPVVVETAHPAYPADGGGRRVDVELVLTVDEQGHVVGSEVLGHIPGDVPESFDRAARDAAAQVRFRPATLDGQPVPVRVRFHMAISPPVVSLDAGVGDAGGPAACELPENEIGAGCEGVVHTHGGSPDAGAAVDHGGDASASAAGNASGEEISTPSTPEPEPEQGVEVRASAARDRTATEYRMPIGALANVPRVNGNDVLRLAPGVVLSNEGGTEGHAEHVYLRGFTGESGQDIAFGVDGVPLNEESNIHAQGYTDLFFVIPELVARLDVTEGVSDPRQGNFAIAGSIDYHLGLPQRGILLRSSLGQYGYRRFAAFYGPAGSSEGTFAGVDLSHADGLGLARDYDRATGMAQYEFALGRGVVARVMASAFTARWNSPGVLREDDFEAQRVGFFGTYAQAGRQGGSATRALVAAGIDYHGDSERAAMRVYASQRDLLIRENFTGFYTHPAEGDLIEQTYDSTMLGANGFYQRDVRLGGRVHQAEVGFFVRYDRAALTSRTLSAAGAPSAMPGADDVDAIVAATNVAAYADATVRPLPRTTLRAGIRLDGLGYQIDANEIPAGGTSPVRSLRRSAFGLHAGPKASAEVHLAPGLNIVASFGTGFRSPDPLALTDGQPTPFTTVTAEELGLRYAAPGGTAGNLTASLAAYHSYVDNDVLFDPYAGREAPVGPTRRLGAVLWVRTQPLPWIDVSASVSYTRSTLESDRGGPALPAGSALPLAPGWVVRLDAAADRAVRLPWSWVPATRVHGGVGMTYVGPRALQLGGSTEPVFLVDAAAGLRLGPVDLSIAARNLFDARARDFQSTFASNFVQGATPSSAPVLHFNAAEPLTVFATLTLYL